MKEFSITNNEKLKRIDPVVLFCVLGMNLMSIVTLLASSDAYGTWYVKVQALASLIGFVGMVVITFIDYDALITKLKYVFFALSVVLMLFIIISMLITAVANARSGKQKQTRPKGVKNHA